MKECLIYPGEYVPLPETEVLVKNMGETVDSSSGPLINMDEQNDNFRVDILIPGAKRKDILVYIRGNILSVIVQYKQAIITNSSEIHEFAEKCNERQIVLPANADPDLISAEFKAGVLSMHIPKKNDEYPIVPAFKPVVVY